MFTTELIFTAAVALLPSLVSAGGVALNGCTVNEKPWQPPNLLCNARGSVANPRVLVTLTEGGFEDCAALCAIDNRCQTFSFDNIKGVCTTYNAQMRKMGWKPDSNSNASFSNKNCNTVECRAGNNPCQLQSTQLFSLKVNSGDNNWIINDRHYLKYSRNSGQGITNFYLDRYNNLCSNQEIVMFARDGEQGVVPYKMDLKVIAGWQADPQKDANIKCALSPDASIHCFEPAPNDKQEDKFWDCKTTQQTLVGPFNPMSKYDCQAVTVNYIWSA